MQSQRKSFGFVRIACVVPEHRVADVDFNAKHIIETLGTAAQRGARIALYPELSVPAYTSADLFYQTALLDGVRKALHDITQATGSCNVLTVVGAPLELYGRIYNCAIVMQGGQVLGVVPKTYLPSTMEYYEKRWFTPSTQADFQTIELNGHTVSFGTHLLFPLSDVPGAVVGVEICEDLWAVIPPSSDQALAGANILLNASASDELLGKADYRRELVRDQAARCLAAYAYSACGPGESSTDMVFGGHALIAENGSLLAESERYHFDSQMVLADIDVDRLNHERRTNSSFSFGRSSKAFEMKPTPALNAADRALEPVLEATWDKLLRFIPRWPFVPGDKERRDEHCREILAIQSTGLARRLRHTGTKQVTLGLSGGLDSTLALLVIVQAFERLNLPLAGIHAITMPGFGTTVRTRSNAERLAELLGLQLRVVPIADAVRQHFRDIGHDEEDHDITFENAQARERTQILMDVANDIGGFVVGTGDLSELALGWMTFNADHMSMYHVNAGVPKTLVRYMIDWCAETQYTGEIAAVLHDIAATPITPELLPLDDKGNLQQQTEDTIGPYLLHDFFLFQVVRNGFAPSKVFYLAQQVFVNEFDDATLMKWLRNFYKRFFANQFKRSVMPDGPKVGTVALSPRGDWRMASDASVSLWMRELDMISVRTVPNNSADKLMK